MRDIIFVIVVSVIGLLSQSTLVAAQDNWTRYESSEGRFSMTFPNPPKVEASNGKEGGPAVMHTFTSRVPGRMIAMLVYGDYPRRIPNVNQELLANRDNFAKAIKGTVTSSGIYQFQRVPGDHLPALDFSVNTDRTTCRSLIVIESPRVGQIGVCGNKGIDVTADTDRILNSFALTPPSY